MNFGFLLFFADRWLGGAELARKKEEALKKVALIFCISQKYD